MLGNLNEPVDREQRLDEAATAYLEALESGQAPDQGEYLARYPDLVKELSDFFNDQHCVDHWTEPLRTAVTEWSLGLTCRQEPGSRLDQFAPQAPAPPRLGRYRIMSTLGSGGFGVVYKGYDDELRRDVAIKVPHRERIKEPEDAGAYLAEARVLAGLDHPNIVPVFDLGRSNDGLCFVVSKFIQGSNLAEQISITRLAWSAAATLVAIIAEALHHAHKRGLVHRDVKPGNVLLDECGKPYLADFGLALKEEDFGKGPGTCGTAAYWSPEQANGEGHRVDGRSDIFSLGVVFYQLLAGRLPFRGDMQDVLKQIIMVEPRPPRQMDDAIPKELERICLKALAKRASERYTTAKDMADDLRHFLASASGQVPAPLADVPAAKPLAGPTPSTTPSAKVIPKGLRSFDAHDAEFFLELLPGPRDREGLPDSIRFWKTRIEEIDPANTFSVGLIYGPSGCGKSSLVKAGLLPRLSSDVIAVYIEATADETEGRLLNGLRKRCVALPANLGLKETLAALRRGPELAGHKKVLIVLDQFEQWLHAKREERDTELVQALRQCDGERVQCIVMVRDDFWMAVTRFLTELEVELVQGKNCGATDLFDLRHAEKVLTAFGRASAALPIGGGELTKDQKQFLEQAVQGLAQEDKIVCVRLALFAEMMKGKSWTPACLKELGGTEGVGVTFLEEAFSSQTANPKHRFHQQAARAVLKALLPESGADLKGQMQSRTELLEASRYVGRPKDFEELLRILDGELRLITPTDPEGKDHATPSTVHVRTKYYQLTHDYLVHSLRDWLTRKQKETTRGRAELLLADGATVWNARPERRQLPSLLQWVQIRSLTQKKNWTPPQRKMMRQANRYHALRGLVVVVLLALIGWASHEGHGTLKAHALRERLLVANTTEVPTIVEDMACFRRWLNPLLHEASQEAEATHDRRKQLHASLALLPVDPGQVDYLYGRLLDAAPHEVPVLRDALTIHKDDLLDKLWAEVETPETGKASQRLRAAATLAKYDPESQQWAKCNALVVNDLVRENLVFLGQWSEALRPVKNVLLLPLSDIFRDHKEERTPERSVATNLLADYAAEQPNLLADLVMDADDKQLAVLYPPFKEHGKRGLRVLTDEIDRELPPDAKGDAKEKMAKRQANAAVVLLKAGQPAKVWPLLKHRPADPRVRSYLIHCLHSLGADAGTIARRLDEEPDTTIRRALILSLGEFGEKEFSAGDRKALLPTLQAIYRRATDPGLHASAEWLMRQWQQEAWLKHVNEEWARDKERESRLDGIKQTLAKAKDKTSPQWYVNGHGQTMVVIPGPVEFLMGSPSTESGRGDNERQHKKRIGRTFAFAAKSVTVEQYRQFDQGYQLPGLYTRMADMPVVGTSWYQAAAYCNWLSKEEGIPQDQWCYEINGQVTKLKQKYLNRTGYRLPTEAEMEYATRAGALTSRFYGETEELLPKYAWYVKNSQERTWPVGTLKPNDLGLFDVQGNAFTWCQESYKDYPSGNSKEAVEDEEDGLVVVSTGSRVLRGGSFFLHASNVRSAVREEYVPTLRSNYIGFRVVRTFP